MSTETVRKTKTPAKPKATVKARATKAKTNGVVAKSAPPSYVEIAQLAERFWMERGWQDGYAEQDWLRAEQELMGA